MAISALAEFLMKTVLDHEFRQLALSDLDRALEGFDLAADETEILRSGDERIGALLGMVVHASWPVLSGPSDHEVPLQSPAATQTLSAIALRLRLVPHRVESPQKELNLKYVATLQPWDNEPPSNHASEPDAGTPESAGDAAVDWLIRIVPTVISLPGSEPRVAYAATIQPPELAAKIEWPPRTAGSPTPEAEPTRYHGNSAVARRAADEVRRASPDQRRARIVDLIQALRTGDGHA